MKVTFSCKNGKIWIDPSQWGLTNSALNKLTATAPESSPIQLKNISKLKWMVIHFHFHSFQNSKKEKLKIWKLIIKPFLPLTQGWLDFHPAILAQMDGNPTNPWWDFHPLGGFPSSGWNSWFSLVLPLGDVQSLGRCLHLPRKDNISQGRPNVSQGKNPLEDVSYLDLVIVGGGLCDPIPTFSNQNYNHTKGWFCCNMASLTEFFFASSPFRGKRKAALL